MLTGQRAFLGKSSHEVLKQAADANLIGAFERLHAADADPELTAIVKRCLAASPADRPADAAAVAALVADHRAGVEARLRKAEADRAAAAIEVQEQRKRRRVQLALAGAVFLLLLGGGACAWTAERRASVERERVARNIAAIEGLLDRADDALRADDAPAASVFLAEAEQRMSEGGSESLGDRYRRTVRDRELLAELDRIDEFRWKNTEGGVPPPAKSSHSGGPPWRCWHQPGRLRRKLERAPPSASASFARWTSWLMPVTAGSTAGVRAGHLAARSGPLPQRHPERLDAREAKPIFAALRAHQPASFAAAMARMYQLPVERQPGDPRGGLRRNPRDYALHMEAAVAYLGAPAVLTRGEGAGIPRGRVHPAAQRACMGAPESSFARKGDLVAAVATMEKTIALDPDDPSTKLHLAGVLRQRGEANRAAEFLREAIRLRPKWEQAHHALTACLSHSVNDPQGARTAAQAAIDANPHLPAGYYYRGLVEAKAGDHVAAIASLDEAIRINPDIFAYHFSRGESNRELKRWKAAATDYATAARLAPERGDALFQLGWACLNGGDRDGAIRAFSQLVKLTPNDPWAHGNLGIALHSKGDHAAAADCYREVVRLEPRSAKFRNEYGMILLAKGDAESALLEYRIALQLEPDSPAAKDGLARAKAALKK
ncbi:MAG: tetratricopeptide repeat protein [Gemmataceae bacterium]